LIVTDPDVATIVPDVLTVLTLAVNVSAPSVVESAVGVTLKLPALLLIVKLPLLVAKSSGLLTVQYNVVPFVTLVVVTLKVSELPSLTLLAAGETEYVGPVDVSLIVTEPDVATIVPDVLPVLTLAVNVSAPSVVESAVGVTLKLPALLVIVKLPLLVVKSPAFVTVQ
jgi:hypothetical protein